MRETGLFMHYLERMKNGKATLENCFGSFLKTEHIIITCPGFALLGIYPRGMKTCIHMQKLANKHL